MPDGSMGLEDDNSQENATYNRIGWAAEGVIVLWSDSLGGSPGAFVFSMAIGATTGYGTNYSDGDFTSRDKAEVVGGLIAESGLFVATTVAGISAVASLPVTIVGAVVAIAVREIGEAVGGYLYDLFTLDSDPDGGANGKNAMVPGYLGYGVPMPLEILSDMQEGIGLGDKGSTLTVGNEFNALDLISELIRRGLHPQIPGNDSTGDRAGDGLPGDAIRKAGDAIDDLLDQGGVVPGAVGNVIRAGANSLAGVVDAGVNLFQMALSASQRQGGQGNQRGDSAADRNIGSGGGAAQSGQAAGSNEGSTGGHSSTVTGLTTSQTTYQSGGTTHTATHVTGGGGGGADSGKAANPVVDRTALEDRRPILLDLDGNGVKISEFQNSTQFQTGKDGLSHRTSWAGTGDGVLFYDAGNDNLITEGCEYVFTEWNPTASGDLEALRSVWDTNGDGKLTAADAEFAKFKVMVTHADGSTSVQTLAALGITEINLTANTVNIELPDGSVITGQTTFTRANGTTGTVANTTLTADAAGSGMRWAA